jgi:hypothetical protein
MPFDASEFDQAALAEAEAEQSVQSVQADTIINQLAPVQDQEVPTDDPNDTDYMLEVEQRLEVAQHYQELLRAPLFSQATVASQIVEREHRVFVKERMEILLGMRNEKDKAPPPPKQAFDDEEITAIKILIASMIKKGMIKAAPTPVTPSAAPSVRLAAPPPSRQAPAVVARPAPVVAQRTQPAATSGFVAPAKPAPKKPGRPPKTERVVTVDHPVTGEPYDMLVKNKQMPAGAVPFPNEQGIEMAAMMQASHSASRGPAGLVDIAAIVAQRTKE